MAKKRNMKWDRASETLQQAMARFDLVYEDTTVINPTTDANAAREIVRREQIYKFIGAKLQAKLENKMMAKMKKGIIWTSDDLIDYAERIIEEEGHETIPIQSIQLPQQHDWRAKMRRESAERRQRSRENSLNGRREKSQDFKMNEIFKDVDIKEVKKNIQGGDITLKQTIHKSEKGVYAQDAKTGEITPISDKEFPTQSFATDKPIYIFQDMRPPTQYNQNNRSRYYRYNNGGSRNSSRGRSQSQTRRSYSAGRSQTHKTLQSTAQTKKQG